MSRITKALLLAAALALLAPAGAAADPAFVSLGSFDAPIYVTAPPRDTSRVFVVERAGRIQVVRNGTRVATPFLDISGEVDSVNGERGLLSMTFAPDYASSGLFYVYMVARQPVGEIQVREYRRSATNLDRADPAGRIVYRATHDEESNHNGGQIEWGPDGYLWFATGDGGGGNDVHNHARDLSSPLGKLLRIDPRPGNAGSYGIPASNPLGTALWAYGLRNPFRFSFDRGTGDLWIGDVGQGAREEVDLAPAPGGLGRGGDYGWACKEGTIAGPKSCLVSASYIAPVLDYARDDDGANLDTAAVTGGYVVRDAGLPTLRGRYVYADAYDGQVRSFSPASPRTTDAAVTSLAVRNTLVSFGEDACGHVYVVSIDRGSVERIQDGAPGACVLKPVPPALPRLGGTGGGGGGPAGSDRTAPRVRIQLARKGRVGRRARPQIALTASESCRVTIRARLAGWTLQRVRGPLRGGHRTIVRLRPKAKAVKRIRRSLRRHKHLTLRVSVTAVDAAGNTGHAQRRLKVKRG
jgi:glucose/arabinose dehydrogenase